MTSDTVNNLLFCSKDFGELQKYFYRMITEKKYVLDLLNKLDKYKCFSSFRPMGFAEENLTVIVFLATFRVNRTQREASSLQCFSTKLHY